MESRLNLRAGGSAGCRRPVRREATLRVAVADPGAIGIAGNLLPLVLFKYTPLDLALPLGISFFTFQGVAYLVDLAAGEEPFASFLDYLLYRSFWAQLVAGPIVRPGELRDQLAT